MIIFFQKSILVLLLCSFATSVFSENLCKFHDFDKEISEENTDSDEKESEKETKLYHFEVAKNKDNNSEFYIIKSDSCNIKRVLSKTYYEAPLDNPFSPPDFQS